MNSAQELPQINKKKQKKKKTITATTKQKYSELCTCAFKINSSSKSFFANTELFEIQVYY